MLRPTAAFVVTAALLGVASGLGLYTFVYAKGHAYLTDDPAACANCHVMNEQYDGWLKASHRSVAGCNDCHVPANLVGKYWTKSRNGFWHSYYFTTQTFHEPIRATPTSRRIAEANCRRCHDAGGPGDGDAVARGGRLAVVHPLPRLGRAPGALRDERRGHEVTHG